MKSFIYNDIENEQVYELYQKTRKSEKPKFCDGCEKRMKKCMYYTESDAGDCYCIECSTIKQ